MADEMQSELQRRVARLSEGRFAARDANKDHQTAYRDLVQAVFAGEQGRRLVDVWWQAYGMSSTFSSDALSMARDAGVRDFVTDMKLVLEGKL